MSGGGTEAETALLAHRCPPHVAFLWIAGINLCLLCVLMPPFQVHDEFQHLFRSYQLTEGWVLPPARDGIPGGEIPVSMLKLVRHTWGTLQIWRVIPPGHHPLARTSREFGQPLAPARRQYTEFLTAGYAPVLYVPQTLGVGLGRLLGLSPLALLLLGRIANATAAVGAMVFALRRLPYGRAVALAFALLPGAQIEYASVAPDASIIAAGFVLVALILDSDRHGAWSRRDVAIGAASAVILCCKLVYAPLLAVGVPGAWRGVRARGARAVLRPLIVPQLIVGLVGLGFGLLWFAATARHLVTPNDPQGAILAKSIAILHHPLRFLTTLAADFRIHGMRYVLDLIGILGARTLMLPPFVYLLVLAGLVTAALVARGPAEPGPAWGLWWNLVVILATIALIQTAMFLLNAKPGVWRVVGLQGRYLLPIGALAAAAGAWLRRSGGESGAGYAVLLALLVAGSIGLDMGTIMGFHLF